jgi:hypothetical protein
MSHAWQDKVANRPESIKGAEQATVRSIVGPAGQMELEKSPHAARSMRLDLSTVID